MYDYSSYVLVGRLDFLGFID